jgi:hypothetical protein
MWRPQVGVLLLLVVSGGWLLSDEPKKSDDPPPRVKGMLPAHFKQLGLSQDQVREIYKIQSVYGAKVDVLVQKIRELKAEEKGEIDKLLTDAQRARLRELKAGDDGTSKTKEPATKADTDKKDTTDKKPAPDKKDK